MQDLLAIILPVYLVIGAGYAAVRSGFLGDGATDGLMQFAQGIALPLVLFSGVARLDLEQAVSTGLFLSFYLGGLAAFVAGWTGARLLFNRPATDCVAIGFSCLFSNTLLLGLPITERAYGSDALDANYALIAFHSPLMYAVGISAMEIVRSHGRVSASGGVTGSIGRGLITNPLIIGIAAGFAVNLTGMSLPSPLWAAVEMISTAGIPAALFGLGGIFVRYRPEGDLRIVTMVVALSLILHPALTWLMGTHVFRLDVSELRSATVTAAMAPGINAYLFAHLYGVGKRISATSILIGTAASIPTVWFWLQILP